MFIRIVTIKCPNERAKKAFKLLNKEVTEEQLKVGLIKQTTVDASETSIIYVKYWISKKHFDKGRKDNKVNISLVLASTDSKKMEKEEVNGVCTNYDYLCLYRG